MKIFNPRVGPDLFNPTQQINCLTDFNRKMKKIYILVIKEIRVYDKGIWPTCIHLFCWESKSIPADQPTKQLNNLITSI